MADLPPIWFDVAPDADYYAALNVHRDASTEEIRRAFFVLSREFHPDKTTHTDDANQQYPRLDRAYKVLSSQPLRLAYDQYGERGVVALEEDKSADEWAVANYVHSDEYVQERVRVLMRRWYEKQLEAPFSSHTECEVEVDARDFVKHPLYSLQQVFNKQFRMIGISQMVMRQSTSIDVSRNTTVVVGGYLYDKHGLGLGALTCGINYITADPTALRIHLNSEVGWTPKLSVHLEQPVSSVTSCFLMPELTVDGLDVRVGVNHVMRLLPQYAPLQGSMMLSANTGLVSSLQFHQNTWQSTATAAVRAQGPSLGLSVRKQVTTSSSAKVAVDLGVGGAALTLGSSGKVSRRSRLSMGLRFALQGISVRIGFARGSVRFVVPVMVAPLSTSNAWNTFVAATAPFLVAAVVRQVVKPAHKRKQQAALQSAHARRVSYLMEARRCALSQQTLMEKQAAKNTAVEGGVNILVARYGQHPSVIYKRARSLYMVDMLICRLRQPTLKATRPSKTLTWT
ncbi:hypothetical protein, variant [Aphanomyces astaci]|uniref:J domain-containing protein n=1 Tax=Aphanomyces astaci TaxID=112090 RepID=W4GEY4_APHAT|nr:hypothetical protein, variant [Aphanomyces astaci]ETV77836.1 hypothetical protein, variant [Aphanomyces astaci]|eukprot:XP_009832946.1 hypothetical protein, variant [Aphanomyces astaci]